MGTDASHGVGSAISVICGSEWCGGVGRRVALGSSLRGVGDPLRGLYDDETFDAIDSWTGPGARRSVRGWRGGLTAGAVAAAGLTGVAAALDEVAEPEIEEARLRERHRPTEAVTVFFVPGDPHATVVLVRPWLLERPGPAILAALG